MINLGRDDKDVIKMYRQTRACMQYGKHAPVYDLPPEAYSFGRSTPTSALNTNFAWYGSDSCSIVTPEREEYLRDSGWLVDDHIQPIEYKLNQYGYREQKDMTDLENLEGVGDCILVTGNSAGFATGHNEEQGFCHKLQEITGKPVYNLSINNGGAKSSMRILDAWSDILKPICTVSHLLWDVTRLEFEDAIQVGNHNWKRVFKAHFKKVKESYGLGGYNEHTRAKFDSKEFDSTVIDMMTEAYEADLGKLMDYPRNIVVMWRYDEYTKLDATAELREKYQNHPNMLASTLIIGDEEESEDKGEWCARGQPRDGVHPTEASYMESAEGVLNKIKEKQWIR